MVIAVIPVGNSKRLTNKHFLKLGEDQIIEIIVSKLYNSNLFEKIVIYSTKPIYIENSETIIDYEEKGPMYVLWNSLKIFNDNIFMIGGDMPFIEIESLKRFFVYPKQLSVIPKWKNGYLEPLHSLYSKFCLNYEFKNSFHEFIEGIPKVFLSAESFSEYEFFNINTQDDYLLAKKIYSKRLISAV